jgi:hypothetical protein
MFECVYLVPLLSVLLDPAMPLAKCHKLNFG